MKGNKIKKSMDKSKIHSDAQTKNKIKKKQDFVKKEIVLSDEQPRSKLQSNYPDKITEIENIEKLVDELGLHLSKQNKKQFDEIQKTIKEEIV
ncbi:MAG: hypothetical protein KAI55_01555, partial [Candidatus Aenigmarchaeota archaeon]|nr:hypothetical protein [Candidatus Aenigmarchaeota archaeon]